MEVNGRREPMGVSSNGVVSKHAWLRLLVVLREVDRVGR